MAQLGDHICGIYFVTGHRRTYLPQVKLESHTTINPVSFTTKLQQTFRTAEAAPQVRYTFPLYDGVTVSGYTISYDNKILTGIVKHKDDAKQAYRQAVSRGETAGLLSSLPAGVFGVTLGNVPAQTDLLVDVTYCGELKHDAAVDGLRYTLPTSVAPRYGSYPGDLLNVNTTATSMRLTVDVDMGNKSAIRRIQSPSHPISVTMGELSTLAKQEAGDATFSPSKASATLSQKSVELGDDFILQVVIDDLSRPQAILEVHPAIPNHRAIMATLVPKFALESANPEIVFIADQSGSMSGEKNAALVAALKVFLKSLPFGVRFNVCAFGNAFQFLWGTSQAYNEENVNRAITYVEGFRAHLGGTELLKPIKAAFERRLQDMPFEVLVLTDGQIWEEQDVFQYVNDEIANGANARVFTLGIGRDVSHTLVEGLARAGNGFAQFVTQNEDTDQKVIRMLKGALYAHTTDYELEVVYAKESADDRIDNDDDFEIVENPQDCLKVSTAEDVEVAEPRKPRSFFDPSADMAKPVASNERYAHLPSLDLPEMLQAPSRVPPLFPFNRSTIYILLDENSSRKAVKSVTLRAKSASGPLELQIPISGTTNAITLHQLAARKAMQDLEEGRGWLCHAKIKADDHREVTVKTKYAGQFDELVEREAVRLGEKFQVASKWTSFVAIQNGQAVADSEIQEQASVQPTPGFSPMIARRSTGPQLMMAQMARPSFAALPPPPSTASTSAFRSGSASQPALNQTFGAGPPMASARSSDQAAPRGFACRAPRRHFDPPASVARTAAENTPTNESQSAGTNFGSGLFGGLHSKKKQSPFKAPAVNNESPPVSSLHEIIGLQAFTGAWKYDARLLQLIGQSDEVVNGLSHDRDMATTALVVAYFEVKLSEKKDVWEMVVGKARAWLAANAVGAETAEALLEKAKRQTAAE